MRKAPSEKDGIDTSVSRTRILDRAEALFARNGFKATSLRAITSEAGVNVASVNYYFRSKDQLIAEVLSRALKPLNQKRLKMLDEAIESSKPSHPPLPLVLKAMIQPCLEISFDPRKEQIFRLLAKSMSEERNFIEKLVKREWMPIFSRFAEVLQKSLPHLSQQELIWKIHFIIGSVVHTACHWQDLEIISRKTVKPNLGSALHQIIDFAVAGLTSRSKMKSFR